MTFFQAAITPLPHLITSGSEHAHKTFASSMGKFYHSTSGSGSVVGRLTISSLVHGSVTDDLPRETKEGTVVNVKEYFFRLPATNCFRPLHLWCHRMLEHTLFHGIPQERNSTTLHRVHTSPIRQSLLGACWGIFWRTGLYCQTLAIISLETTLLRAAGLLENFPSCFTWH